MGKMLKVFEKAKLEAEEALRITTYKIRKANAIAKKVKPLLPLNWEVDYAVSWNGLMFSKDGEKGFSTFEFRNVCNLVEKIISKRLTRNPYTVMGLDNTERLSCLCGQAYVDIEKGYSLSIDIRMNAPWEGQTECEITYTEKVVKIAKVDLGCLGHSEFDKKENLEK